MKIVSQMQKIYCSQAWIENATKKTIDTLACNSLFYQIAAKSRFWKISVTHQYGNSLVKIKITNMFATT